jgi:hypothetical protein
MFQASNGIKEPVLDGQKKQLTRKSIEKLIDSVDGSEFEIKKLARGNKFLSFNSRLTVDLRRNNKITIGPEARLATRELDDLMNSLSSYKVVTCCCFFVITGDMVSDWSQRYEIKIFSRLITVARIQIKVLGLRMQTVVAMVVVSQYTAR